MKKALVIGHTGQDGSYLTEYLISLNYQLVGVSSSNVYNPSGFSLPDFFSLGDLQNMGEFLRAIEPDEIYYLAAYHQSSTDTTSNDGWLFEQSFQTNTIHFTQLLQALVDQQLKSRVFYAASSHVFGLPAIYPQTEETPFNPQNIYGISKVAAIHAARYYWQTHGVYTAIGILYNHESPRRADKFVTQKIIKSAVAIKRGEQERLVLGDLSAQIDWGYAPDFVRAYHSILQLPEADTFIIATGNLHTVSDFAQAAFMAVGLNSDDYVSQKEGIITKKLNGKLCGNYSKLKNAAGWEPTTTFAEMIQLMIDSEWQKH